MWSLGQRWVRVIGPPIGVSFRRTTCAISRGIEACEPADQAIEFGRGALRPVDPLLCLFGHEPEPVLAGLFEGRWKLLPVDHEARVVIGWTGQNDLEQAEGLDAILGSRVPIQDEFRTLPRSDKAPAPTGRRRIRRVSEHVGHRGGVAHLDDAAKVACEVFPQGAVAGDMRIDEALVAEVAGLVPPHKPTAVGRVVLDDPQIRVVLFDVVVGGRAPLLVRPSNEVDAKFVFDRRVVVKRLRDVFDRPPNQDVERARVITASTLDDPVRPFGRVAVAGADGELRLALFGDRPQVIRAGIVLRPRRKVGKVLLVLVDDLEDVARATGRPWGRHQPLNVEHVGVEQKVDHRLKVVWVGAADVG